MDLDKVGKFIAENRKLQNLTQKDLGELLRINSKTVSKWERGINAPDIALLTELAKYLNVSVEDILAGEKLKKDKLKFINKLFSKSNKTLKFVVITFIIVLIITIGCTSLYKYKLNDPKPEAYSITTDNEEYSVSGYVFINKDDYTLDIPEIKLTNVETKDNNRRTVKFVSLYIDIFCDGKLLYSYSYTDEKEHILSQELQNIKLHFNNKSKKYRNLNPDGENELIIKYCEFENECHATNVHLSLKKTE